MKKRLVSLLWIAAPVLPGLAVGGAPVPFDKWSVSNGAVTAACYAGVSCADPVTGPGMYQRELTVTAASEKYMQSIITDSKVSGSVGTIPFSSESFVKEGWASTATKAGVNADGIAVKQVVKSADGYTSGGMDLTTQIYTGWAKDASVRSIDILQTNNGVSFGSTETATYHYAANQDTTGKVTGFLQDMDALLIGSAKYDPRRQNLTTDYVYFARRERFGDLNPGSGTSLPAGADVQVTWIGEYFVGGGESSTNFGYLSTQNISSGRPGSFSRDFESAGATPRSWNTLFGPKPSLPAGIRAGGGG